MILQSMGLRRVGHHLATEQRHESNETVSSLPLPEAGDSWATIRHLTTGHLFTFLRARKRWASCQTLTTSLLFAKWDTCLTLCNPMDCSLPGSSFHEILQARILEWVAIPFSRGSSWHRDQTRVSCISYNGRRILYCTTCTTQVQFLGRELRAEGPAHSCLCEILNSNLPSGKLLTCYQSEVKSLSHVRLLATPWTVAYHAPPCMDFPGKSTGVGCHFLLQGIFLTQGWNWGLLHCRQTLYRLTHQGSPTCYQRD